MVELFRFKSRLIIALDPPAGVGDSLGWALRIVGETKDLVAGYELGLPMIIRSGGLNNLARLLDSMGDEKLKIADIKLADINDMMILSIEPLIDIGFNAFTAHTFIGYDGGLRDLGEYLSRKNVSLISIVSMSHRGGVELFDKLMDRLVDIAIRSGSWGLVAPATRPWILRQLRRLLEERGWRHIKIIAPGIGAQGGLPGEALRNGADFEVVGRLVTRDSFPRRKALEIVSIHENILKIIESWR